MIYFDTAYLLKCYVKEPGWEKVRELAREREQVSCSVYGRMELHAALHRKYREGDLSQTQFETIFRQFDLDESQGLWSWLLLTEEIIDSVTRALRALPRSVHLRTADALHLATASNHRFREIYSNDVHLLAAASCFEITGRNVLDPA